MDARRFVTPRAAWILSVLLLAVLTLAPLEVIAQSPFVVPEPSAAARDWSRHRDLLWLVEQALAVGLAALLLFSRRGAELRTRLDRITGGRRLLTATLFAGVYAALAIVVNLPVSATRQMLAEPLGLAAPGWGMWAAARAGGAWPLLAGSFLLGWAPYLLFSRSPRLWPIWAGALMITVAAAALITQPARHDLRPVTDLKLKQEISRLAVRAGAPDVRFAIRRADRDEPCGGATVLGLGPTKVLALDSALLRHHSRREVAQTIAHELKHYTRNDDRQGLYVAVALVVGGLTVLFFASAFALRRGARRFGFDQLSDPASLPLVVLILTVFALAGSAAFHGYGRHIEQEADRFGLELTHDNVAQAVQMQRYLSCSRLKDPDVSWIQQTFQRNHPSIRARIGFARDYRPWVTGERQVYGHRFRGAPQGEQAAFLPDAP